MTNPTTPYIAGHPGDLITAEDWNGMQIQVRQDIAKQVAASIAGVKDVAHATSADKLGGMTLAELTKYILDQAFAQIPKRTGYLKVFCNLQVGVDKVVQHNLKAYPLADVYQLDYFEGVCAKDDKPDDAVAAWVLFYLYHADERRLRIPQHTDPINIETDPKFRVLWKTLLDQFREQKLLDWDDDTTIEDLEVDFWRAMFRTPPNDSFDADAYCHSPWFEKCCGEQRTVGELKRRGDFDDIYLKIKPQKTINYPPPQSDIEPKPEPTMVRVSQLDLDTVALRLLDNPTYPHVLTDSPEKIPSPSGLKLPENYTSYLPVMLLLKV